MFCMMLHWFAAWLRKFPANNSSKIHLLAACFCRAQGRKTFNSLNNKQKTLYKPCELRSVFAMSDSVTQKKESRAERTERIASALINEERSRREKKTAWLREMRMKAERSAAS